MKKRIAIVAIGTAGLATPLFAAEPSPAPSYIVPVVPTTDVLRGPIYVDPSLASYPSTSRSTQALPVVPAAFSWVGCYVGGHVGGVVSGNNTTNLFGVSTSFDSAAVVGGGQIGCDYQYASGWVTGIEGRIAGMNLKDSHASTVTNLNTGISIPSQFALSNGLLASATGRLGYSFANRWLLYARGGAAWTQEKADDAFTTVRGVAVDPSASLARTGWTVGAGLDWAFSPQWSMTVEYDYYDFGRQSAKLTDTANDVFVSGILLKDAIQAVTVGLNRHF